MVVRLHVAQTEVRPIYLRQIFQRHVVVVEQAPVHHEYRVVYYGEQRDVLEEFGEHSEDLFVVLLAAFGLEAVQTAHGEVFVIATIKHHRTYSKEVKE